MAYELDGDFFGCPGCGCFPCGCAEQAAACEAENDAASEGGTYAGLVTIDLADGTQVVVAPDCDAASEDVLAADGRYLGRVADGGDGWWYAFDDDDSSIGRDRGKLAAVHVVKLAGE